MDYRFIAVGGVPSLKLSFWFDASTYTTDGPPSASASSDPSDVPAWQQRAEEDLEMYRTIVGQLTTQGITISVVTTLDASAAHAR